MSIGTTIDAEPNPAAQALALKRALVELIADATPAAIDATTLDLLMKPVDLRHMLKFGGGTTSHNTTRTQAASLRVANFNVAQVENHLADIDKRIKALGGA
jgi:hypothetical protein